MCQLDNLINHLCVDLGFCIPEADAKEILKLTKITADEFAILILKAEGMDPEIEVKWYRQIKKYFSDRFGNVYQASEN